MKKILFVFAAVAIALTACEKQPEAQGDYVPGKVTVEPLVTRATEVNFEEGDKIGLTILKGESAYAENALMTYSGNIFSGDLNWYDEAEETSTLIAYYPYAEGESVPTSFIVASDQSEGLSSSDFMSAVKTEVKPSESAVNMIFKHLLTKLSIKIDNRTEADFESVEIAGTVLSAKVDAKNQVVTSDESAMTSSIEVCQVGDSLYAAIIVPQTATLTLEVTLADGTVLSQDLAEMTLKQGGVYDIAATVTKEKIVVFASGEIENWTDEGPIGPEEEKIFEEFDGYFVYAGREYKTVTFANGQTWMAENLAYIPEGMTVSSDPLEDAGIWYPAANADKVADPELVESLGILYDAATAFGVESITEETAASFEGCQGICPEGWHIPTVAEMTGLVGHCSNSEMIDTEGLFYDADIKGASLAALSEAGWTWQFASCRNKTSVSKNGSYLVTNYDGVYGVMSYLIGSSLYQVKNEEDGSLSNVQYYYMMPTYNATNEKVSVAYGNFLAGASLRCVKDAE